MSNRAWLDADVEALATGRILDAAGNLYAEQAGAKVNMADIADGAGCSRATLYRYFESRDALRQAYVQRETRRIGALVAAETAQISDPRAATTERIIAAIRHVRAEPLLHAWFSPDHGGAGPAAAQAAAIEAMVAATLGDPTDAAVVQRARWVVRVIVSLLTMPEASEQAERTQIEQFVAPVITRTAEPIVAARRPG